MESVNCLNPNCKKPNAVSNDACVYCLFDLPLREQAPNDRPNETQPTNGTTCSECGTPTTGSTSECTNCDDGLPVSDESLERVEAVERSATQCSVCGSMRSGDASRCEYCLSVFTLTFPWGTVTLADGEQLIVGRDPSLPLAIDLEHHGYNNVSRRHVLIRATSGSIELEDLGSTNGTYINGSPLSSQQPRAVSVSDTIELGRGDRCGPPLTISLSLE